MEKKGFPVKSLETSPELLGEQWSYYECFNDLGSERISGFSLGPIPWSSIINWCLFHGITDHDDIDDYVFVIGRADSLLQRHLDKKTQKQTLVANEQPKDEGSSRGS